MNQIQMTGRVNDRPAFRETTKGNIPYAVFNMTPYGDDQKPVEVIAWGAKRDQLRDITVGDEILVFGELQIKTFRYEDTVQIKLAGLEKIKKTTINRTTTQRERYMDFLLLNGNETAEAIRKRINTLLLAFHPDKLQQADERVQKLGNIYTKKLYEIREYFSTEPPC